MTVSLLLLMMILLDFTNDVWMLPAVSSIFMESFDMKHTLRWPPLQASCNTTVLYYVQYQGAFELLHQNGRWVNATECQQIPRNHCDLTSDLGSDSDYNLQVRAQCSSRVSAWTKLSPPFNRRDTKLMVPKMTVTSAGDALQVSFDKLPLTSTVDVTVWKKGDELQTVVHSMPAGQEVLHIAALQEGAVYCVRAQTVLNFVFRSNSTAPQCVSVTGPDAAPWKTPTTLTVTIIITAGLLFALFWSIVHRCPHACKTYFHKELLPESLRNWDIQIPMSPQEQEVCEQNPMVVNTNSKQTSSQTDAALITHQEA